MTQPPAAYVISLAVDPKNTNIVFAGTDKGIFESKDGAKTWQQLNQFKGLDVHALVFSDGSNNSTLFGFSDIIGFQKSDDKGITWTKVNTNKHI